MDALRAAKFPGQEDKVIFFVKRLKVHNGWAWSEVVPQNPQGAPIGEGFTALSRFQGGKWKYEDLGKAGESSATKSSFIDQVLKLHPGVPADILPARRE